MTFEVFTIEPGRYLNSPKIFHSAGTIDAATIEDAAVLAMYQLGNSQIAVRPVNPA